MKFPCNRPLLKLRDLIMGDIQLAENVNGFNVTVLTPAPTCRAGFTKRFEPLVIAHQ